jgi:hypothetical protein
MVPVPRECEHGTEEDDRDMHSKARARQDRRRLQRDVVEGGSLRGCYRALRPSTPRRTRCFPALLRSPNNAHQQKLHNR